ncbi:hypothetical protein KAX35_07770 [candidate division WOR-3 bacterium]|nr:hypothetical protein [candidate division WOR-3 bacterium]
MKGSPRQEHSVVYAEEYIHGKLHKLTFVITKVVPIPNRRIEFAPVSRFLRRYAPRNTFSIEPQKAICVFTSTAHLRLPLLPRLLARKSVERGVSSAKKHIEEEVENLKKILESEKGIT